MFPGSRRVARAQAPRWRPQPAPRPSSENHAATMWWSCAPRFRILLNRRKHARVSETSTEHTRQCLPDFVVGRLRISVEKCFRADDPPAQAEAALRRFLADESLLYGMRLLGGAQPFQGHNLRVIHPTHGGVARTDRAPIHNDRTRSTLTESATEFRSPQMQFVAEHIKQRSFRIDVNHVDAAVDLQRNRTHILTRPFGQHSITTGLGCC